MMLLFALVGAGLLLFGLFEVWHARWRPFWIAIGYTAMFVVICFTAEQWFRWLGMSRGDGFILIGYFMVGGIAFLAGITALILSPIVAAIGRRRAKLVAKD